MNFTTRFAPSPTGPLHLGHAYSALVAYNLARAAGGTFHLRIEDIDTSRARPHWETQIYDDLRWLGLTWPEPVLRQSARLHVYQAALHRLWALGLLYPCICNRRDIREAIAAPQERTRAFGPDGLIYPGTCRCVPEDGPLPTNVALRLNMNKAVACLGDDITFTEHGQGPDGQTGRIQYTAANLVDRIGDVVLARKDMGTSYHLSVVIDDAQQCITHVVRGQDLFDATAIHIVLQRLLGLPQPVYHHHALIRDDTGKRLAKRDDARAIALYRADGATHEEVRAMVGLT